MIIAMELKEKLQYPFHIMLHPIDGFDELRYRKAASIRISLIIFAALVMLDVMAQQLTGLQYSMADRDKVDIIKAFLSRFSILTLWVLSNWAFCILMDGKAKFVEIWIITCYSLLPYIIIEYIRVILSNFLTTEEGIFLSFLTILGVLWSLVMIISAFMNFHEYEFLKTILAMIYTVVGMLIIIFLIFLIYSLFSQISVALTTVFNEVLFRMRLNN